MARNRNIAKACLRITELFEAELLTELLLRHWNHPRATDREYRSALLESAAQVLRSSASGEVLFPELAPDKVNLVAAIWYAESVTLDVADEITPAELEQRREWLFQINRALPSCFCNPDDLTP